MKSREHQISGSPTQFLNIAFLLATDTLTQTASCLKGKQYEPGESADRRLQGKDFRVPGSPLDVTTRTLIYNCDTPHNTNRFSGTSE